MLLPVHKPEVQQDRDEIGGSRKGLFVQRCRLFVLTAGEPAVAGDVEKVCVMGPSDEKRLDDHFGVVDLAAAEMGGGCVAGLDDGAWRHDGLARSWCGENRRLTDGTRSRCSAAPRSADR